MKRSMYEVTAVKNKYYSAPCKIISKIGLDLIEAEYSKSNETMKYGDTFTFWVGFPDQIKIITQSKAVDIHQFIGNIGGYIGLFLGKFT